MPGCHLSMYRLDRRRFFAIAIARAEGGGNSIWLIVMPAANLWWTSLLADWILVGVDVGGSWSNLSPTPTEFRNWDTFSAELIVLVDSFPARTDWINQASYGGRILPKRSSACRYCLRKKFMVFSSLCTSCGCFFSQASPIQRKRFLGGSSKLAGSGWIYTKEYVHKIDSLDTFSTDSLLKSFL